LVEPSKNWSKEVIDSCVKCRKCGEPILLVFDETIRDKHDECGGKPTQYDKNIVDVE
jgi:hypothetical protein